MPYYIDINFISDSRKNGDLSTFKSIPSMKKSNNIFFIQKICFFWFWTHAHSYFFAKFFCLLCKFFFKIRVTLKDTFGIINFEWFYRILIKYKLTLLQVHHLILHFRGKIDEIRNVMELLQVYIRIKMLLLQF